ncbi:hypothetical protein PF005_g24791 [Phytophthora fragariae]|uniref:PiggyBac transposable element-derived protein domain-containing protein n=2 Tax=Phytophthora fragariae TaxID=53985 RepID=A0A6A3W239_9STRA|nr:hypothetical protein PF005_g24791 [Phytophthora fragariae]
MRDYHRWMGGVDVHDQLRLQRYSLQLAVRFRKYYKTIFLGLVDMAIVNAYIVYREAQKLRGEPPSDHAAFLRVLQAPLLQVAAQDLMEELFSPAAPEPEPSMIPVEHKLTEFPEWVQIREGVRKRPQHQCKVCSIRKQKSGERRATRFFCEACSDGNKRVRPTHYPGNTMTCHQIWHVKWKNGEERPPSRIGRGIQMRGLGKKQRRRASAHDETVDDEEGEDEEGDEGEEGEEVDGDGGQQ